MTSPPFTMLYLALYHLLIHSSDAFLGPSPSSCLPPHHQHQHHQKIIASHGGLLEWSKHKQLPLSDLHASPRDADIVNDDNDDNDDDDIDDNPNQQISVTINTQLTDEKLKQLFAWIKCAFDYDEGSKNDVYAYYYNNIELAIAAVFGDNLPKNSIPAKLLAQALKNEGLLDKQTNNNNNNSNIDNGDEEDEWEKACSKEWEERLVGDPIGRRDRESASLGAMGAAQWTGQWMTRPHSLLDIYNYTSVDDWIKTLPRGCKRTLKKATPQSQNFTVSTKQIQGGQPAPHSSYAHFRCVVHHEVRLLSNMYGASTGAFVNALAEAISRYMGTTRMAGTIREYRDESTDKVIGFAHEVAKARTIRGQWFYCDDDAATRYVWFHSVRDLVQRAIEDERIDIVDLGPSGSDAFTELKAKYGFESVEDWPSVADYTSGDFHYEEDQNEVDIGDDVLRMIEKLMQRQAAREAKQKDAD